MNYNSTLTGNEAQQPVNLLVNKIIFKGTQSLSNAICITHNIFLPEYIWMTKKFRTHEVITQRVPPVIFKIMGPTYRCNDLDLSGSCDVSCHVTFDSPGAISYRCSIVTESVSPAIFGIMGPKHIGVTTFAFLSHVTSSVTIRHMSFSIGVSL